MEHPRLGLSVSKKVGNAVVRNLVRRRLREIFNACLAEIPKNYDLVVSARPGASEASYAELEAEFRKAIARLSSS